VAYYFGREIRKVTGHPVGMIATSWGGTPGQAWTSIEGLQKAPGLAHYITDAQHFTDGYAAAKANFLKAQTDFPALKQKWDEEVGPVYKTALTQWQDAANQAKAAGQPAPPKPAPTSPAPVMPKSPDELSNTPTGLFNGMVAPIIPYAMNKARQLLRQSDLSIGQIAEATGYRDVYFFSRQFKFKTGQTPTKYRMTQHEELGKDQKKKGKKVAA